MPEVRGEGVVGDGVVPARLPVPEGLRAGGQEALVARLPLRQHAEERVVRLLQQSNPLSGF